MLLIGGTLIAVLLMLAAPCGRGRCAPSADGAQVRAALAHAGPTALPVAESPLYCMQHGGVLLMPALLMLASSALAVRVASGARSMALRANAPPPLPPPQAA